MGLAPGRTRRWTSLSTVFIGYTYHDPYVLPSSAGLYSGLIWGVDKGGPTGDGINEIAWCSGSLPASVGFFGLTSMLVDPTTGVITECDIFFEAVPSAAPWPAGGKGAYNVVGPSPFLGAPYPQGGARTLPAGSDYGSPSGTSVIPHEVGHFFGLDHTNLHPGGWGSIPGGAVTSSGLVTFPAWTDWPCMAGGIFSSDSVTAPGAQPGFHFTSVLATRPGVDPAAGGLHPDDITGICRLYPTSAVGPTVHPLINEFARIEGQALTGSPPQPVWGRNVYPLLIDAAGTVSSTAPNAALSGTHRLGPTSVVGSQDSVTGVSTSGGFSLPYVLVGPAGSEYAVGMERLENVVPTPTFSEWIIPVPPMVTGSSIQNSIPLAATAFPVLLRSAAKPYPTSKGSLYCFPGSVITVTVNESAAGTPGPTFTTVQESLSRPAISLTPRSGYTSSSMEIKAEVFCDYPLKLTTPSWTVGGRRIAAGPPTLGPGDPPTVCGPYVYTWVTTADTLNLSPGTLVKFSVQEGPPIDNCGPPPPAFAVGVNECWF